jgi:heparan-alpha-glucosaminide N-acetyltransferase
MNVEPTTAPQGTEASAVTQPSSSPDPSSRRVVSLDIFRGLTMAVMIFVNALPESGGLPWWTHHAHASEDRMTYVDMVFPFFLFIVGMSLPLSIAHRLKKNPSTLALWPHILLRSLSLLVLGLILANAEKADPVRMGINGFVWALLALLSAALYLNVYPRSKTFRPYAIALRIAGFAGTAILLAIFRRTTASGHVAWLDFSYPEILGLIGISYFASALVYIPTRNSKWMQWIWFLLFLALNIVSTAHLWLFPSHVPLYIWPFGNGAMPCIILAGVVTANLLMPSQTSTPSIPKLWPTLAFGIGMLLAGFLLTPLGISKIRATPTWCLYSAGAAAIMIAGLYWLCDIRRHTAWAFLLKPAGANTLLTYLLPDFWYFLTVAVGFTWLDTHFAYGAPVVLKTIAFTLVMLVISAGLTRLKLRLQL